MASILSHGINLGVIGFAVFMLTHWIVFRVAPVRHRSRFLLTLLALVIAGVLVAAAWPGMETSLLALRKSGAFRRAVPALVALSGLFILYMPFYYTIQTSISIGMLIKLACAATGSLPVDALRPDPASEEVLRRRMETMEANGYLSKTSGGFALTGKGRGVAQFFLFVKRLWRLGPGG